MDVASLLVKIGLRADTKPLDALQSKLESINGKLRILAGAEIIKGLFHLTENFGHSALELENTAAAAGLTTEAMQKLQFAVAQSGGNAGELGMTMTHLARLIEAAKLGGDEAITTFYKLGISQQAIASYHSTEEALYGVMDALQNVRDPMRRQALLGEALGQGARGLGRFALAGSAAAKAMTQNAKAMGAIVPGSTIRQLANAKASLDGLGQIFRSVSATIGGTFAPVVIEVVHAVEKFYVANQAVIRQTFEQWVVSASGALGFFVGLLETVGGAVFRFAGRNADLLKTLLKSALIFAAVSSGLETLAKALATVRGVWAGATGLIAAAPFLATAAAIGTCVAALHDFVELMTTHSLKDSWLAKEAALIRKGGSALLGLGERAGSFLGDMLSPADDGPMMPPAPGRSFAQTLSGDDLNVHNFSYLMRGMQPPAAFVPSGPRSDPAQVQVTSNVTVNVPPDMSPADAQKAVATGVRDHMDGTLSQAYQRFYSPMAY